MGLQHKAAGEVWMHSTAKSVLMKGRLPNLPRQPHKQRRLHDVHPHLNG